MTSVGGRKPLIVLFGLQIVFAAIVTLAAFIFLAAGSAKSGQDVAPRGGISSAEVVITTKSFDPNLLSLSDYND